LSSIGLSSRRVYNPYGKKLDTRPVGDFFIGYHEKYEKDRNSIVQSIVQEQLNLIMLNSLKITNLVGE